MIVNNNKVQGIYLYYPDIEYTKNDLVVYSDSIYICDAESVSGINPVLDTNNDYFRPYPGSKIITASEFFEYVKSGASEGGDKYVSVQAIMGILQGYQFGLDMTGVISDYIDSDGETTLELSSPTDRPLDNLMLTENLNRGMIKVSPGLRQIVDGTLDGTTNTPSFSTVFGILEKSGVTYQLLLSQYTYKSSDDTYVRIQEMSSPLTGVSVYRYMTWTSGKFPSDGSVVSGWRNVFSYSSAIQSKMNALQNYYEKLGNQLTTQVSSLRGSFRFREIHTGGTSRTGLSSGIYTVCLRQKQTNTGEYMGDIYKSESVVVKLASGSNYRVYLNNITGYLEITPTSITFAGGESSVTEIISIYSRQTYE